MNILLVEDYQDLKLAMTESLKRQNHHVVGLDTAEEVDAALARQRSDLALIDLNLPREDGLSLIKRMRHAHPDMGIIIISARNSTLDRVSGYQSGADIYLTKPVGNEELTAAINGLARRLNLQPIQQDEPVPSEQTVQVDSQTLQLRGPQGTAHLTTTEFTLLAGLVRARDRTLETQQIYQMLGRADGKKSALEALVYRIRRKMAEAGAGDNSIRSHRLKGYQLFCPVRIV
jgi:DNA-binding response OmpR family regulator